MLNKDLILLLIGTVLGYLGTWIPSIKKTLVRREIRRRTELLRPEKLYDWILKYHNYNGTIDDLFKVSLGNYKFTIPFLVDQSWLYFKKTDIVSEEVLNYRGKGGNFRINKALLSKKKRLNQKIFDEPTIYVENVTFSKGTLALEARECRYFEMISSISVLEEETISAIRRKKYKGLSVRDAYLKSMEVAKSSHNIPFSIGCVVLLAFRTSKGYELLFQKRSAATATYGGYRSVIPSYGLVPPPKSGLTYSLSFYNFIKEFAEELFDYEELIQQMSSKRGDLVWFLETPEIKKIIDSFKKGNSEYIFTGFGIDILNGTNTLSYLCIINDLELIDQLKLKIKANWESEGGGGDLALELVESNDPNLVQEIRSNKFHFGSVFCIVRGLEYLQQNELNGNESGKVR